MNLYFLNRHSYWMHNLTDISFSAPEENVSISINGEIVFNEVLTPDEDGLITIYDFPSLIDPFVGDEKVTVLFIERNITFDVYPSEKCIKDVTFIPTDQCFPLSASNVTYCFLEDEVLLHFLQLSRLVTSVNCRFLCIDADGDTFEATASLTLPENGTLAFSPSVYYDQFNLSQCSPTGVLIYAQDKLVHQFIFIQKGCRIEFYNNFKKKERIAIPGILKISPTFNRVIGTYKGSSHVIETDEDIKYSIECAPCSKEMIKIIEDIANSKDCWLAVNGEMVKVIPDDCEFGYSSESNEYNQPKLSFIRADNNNVL